MIPVFNGERYLRAAIESALAQTHPAAEIIVMDDGSTDGTATVAHSFGDKVRYHRHDHAGIVPTRNAAVQYARGPWLAFLDADDLWLPEKLSRQFAAIQTDPTLEMVFGHLLQFVSPELDAAARAALQCPATPESGWHCGTMLVRKEVFARVGLFNPQWRAGEFIDWHTRAQEKGVRMQMLPDVVMHRRLHLTNTMRQQKATTQDYTLILKQMLDRRRAAAKEGAAP